MDFDFFFGWVQMFFALVFCVTMLGAIVQFWPRRKQPRRQQLIDMPLWEVHAVGDDEVELQVISTPNGAWSARLSSPSSELDFEYPTFPEAAETVRLWFSEQHPNHTCSSACRILVKQNDPLAERLAPSLDPDGYRYGNE